MWSIVRVFFLEVLSKLDEKFDPINNGISEVIRNEGKSSDEDFFIMKVGDQPSPPESKFLSISEGWRFKDDPLGIFFGEAATRINFSIELPTLTAHDEYGKYCQEQEFVESLIHEG